MEHVGCRASAGRIGIELCIPARSFLGPEAVVRAPNPSARGRERWDFRPRPSEPVTISSAARNGTYAGDRFMSTSSFMTPSGGYRPLPLARLRKTERPTRLPSRGRGTTPLALSRLSSDTAGSLLDRQSKLLGNGGMWRWRGERRSTACQRLSAERKSKSGRCSRFPRVSFQAHESKGAQKPRVWAIQALTVSDSAVRCGAGSDGPGLHLRDGGPLHSRASPRSVHR